MQTTIPVLTVYNYEVHTQVINIKKKDKSADIEQQPPFGDRK